MRQNRRYAVKLFASLFILFAAASLITNSPMKKTFTGAMQLSGSSMQPLIVVITPTYRRATRFADMTRLANTLRNIPDLYWIVVEDANTVSRQVEGILNRTNLPFTYMPAKTVAGYPRRGWYQRTTALNYLRQNKDIILDGHTEGVLYFADDDNAYDVRLFTEYIRHVKKIGIWAVGFVGGSPIESLDVKNGSVVGFKVKWNPKRRFAVDMAGFAINLQVVFNSTAVFGTECKRGGGAPETCLLEDMGLTRADIQPFGHDKETDRELYVWHTKTVQPKYDKKKVDKHGFIMEI